MQPSTLSSWALLIWQELKHQGLDPRPIFTEVNLDPALLNQNMGRYKQSKMTALWQLSYERTNDPLFGLKVGDRWSPTTFHALGFAWLASDNLLHAFQRMSRYGRLINDAVDIQIQPENGKYRFYLGWNKLHEAVETHTLAHDAAHCACLKMCRMLLGDNFTPLEVSSRLPRGPGIQALEDLFATSIQCNSEVGGWLISHFDMHKNIASGNNELATINDNIALKYLSTLDKTQILPALQHALIEALPSGEVSENDMAEKLHMSPRTLQRKLEAENETFSSILQQLRKKLSVHYIEKGQLSLTEITYLLGFSEQASFSRAFKRWYQQSPSEYQKQLKKSA